MVALNEKNAYQTLADEYEHFDAFEPTRCSEKGRYPVRSNQAQSKAKHRSSGRSQKLVHRSFAGVHKRHTKRELVH